MANSFLGKATGKFVLEDSNRNVGSLFTIEDILTISEINQDDVPNIPLYLKRIGILDKDNLVDETKLYKCFGFLKKMFSSNKPAPRSSFDEYVLIAIMKHDLPYIEYEHQPVIKDSKQKYCPDFLLKYKGKSVYLEFDGPQHFIDKSKKLDDPFIRSERIQEITGIEVVHWPYWIQRCSRNIKAIFESGVNGTGSLWSCNAMFSDFTLDNAQEVIIKMTKRFNAFDEDGIGYFYEKDSHDRLQPEHPIIRKILTQKEDVNKLIPRGAVNKKFWLPRSLWDML